MHSMSDAQKRQKEIVLFAKMRETVSFHFMAILRINVQKRFLH